MKKFKITTDVRCSWKILNLFFQVFGVQERDADLNEDDLDEENSKEDSEAKTVEESKPEDVLISTFNWNWDMSAEDRWIQCQLLEEEHNRLMSKFEAGLKKEAEVTKIEHAKATIRAKSKAYENKAVIGGTMVGCIQRLEAIRYN